jgi:5-methylcytosine-specific restriction endonuclease McrA
MSRTQKRLVLNIAQSDTESEAVSRPLQADHFTTQSIPDHAAWRTRCLHCRTWLYLAADGQSISNLTIEHIVPQSWFARRAIIARLALPFTDANDLRNLALACARCNHDKGKGHDTKPSDERAQTVVLQLVQTRLQRYRLPENN